MRFCEYIDLDCNYLFNVILCLLSFLLSELFSLSKPTLNFVDDYLPYSYTHCSLYGDWETLKEQTGGDMQAKAIDFL